jgi:hypothetical protein
VEGTPNDTAVANGLVSGLLTGARDRSSAHTGPTNPTPSATVTSPILRFNGSVERDPAIRAWMDRQAGELGAIARYCFEEIRACGDDVRELLHDGHPTACIGDAAFAYVNVFNAHVNVGFFRGAELADPDYRSRSWSFRSSYPQHSA